MFGLSPAQVINNFRWSCQGNNDEGSSDEGSSWIVQLNMFCNIESGMRLCNINESEALNSSHQHESIILSYQSSAPGIFALQDDWVCWALHCTLINTWNKELSEFFRKNFNLNIDASFTIHTFLNELKISFLFQIQSQSIDNLQLESLSTFLLVSN